jgi:uncharacterized membrane protein YcaP (DUF421 family)
MFMEIGWQLVWKSVVIAIAGIALVRIAGRKSVAQMSVASTVIMISVGALLAEGVMDKPIWGPLVAVGLFLCVLILLETMQLNSRYLYRIITGKSVIVIRDGRADEKQLRKLRMTYEQLEMRLRQKQVSRISDVQTATIEVNGEIGIELMRHARPVTVGDLDKVLERMDMILSRMNETANTGEPDKSTNIFEEVKRSEASDALTGFPSQ